MNLLTNLFGQKKILPHFRDWCVSTVMSVGESETPAYIPLLVLFIGCAQLCTTYFTLEIQARLPKSRKKLQSAILAAGYRYRLVSSKKE